MHARSRWLLVLLLAPAALFACGPATSNPTDGPIVLPDFAPPRDLLGADLATRPDLVVVDMAPAPDLATPDLSVPVDMTVPADMVKPVDLLTIDLAVADMGRPPDLAVVDLTPPPDLTYVDLAPPPDLATLTDMAMMAAPTLLVTHVGDGMAALTSAATPVTVRKFKLDGSELMVDKFPLALPVAVNGNNQPITVSGSATSEGAITLSSDGRYAVVAGYAATVGTAAVNGTASMATNRVIGRIDLKGNIDTTTRTDTPFSGVSIRAAATDDGTRFWVSGGSSGMQLLPFGKLDPGTQILATPANERVVNIFGGQLYVTSGSANYTTVMSVGMGLPTMAGQVIAIGMGLGGTSPYGFAVLDLDPNVAGADTIYIADDSTAAKGGGAQKWTFDGAKWTLATTLNGGLTNGMRGIVALVTNKVVTLYATTSESSANSLISIIDQGMNPMATVLATAPANTAFRSVCLAPTN